MVILLLTHAFMGLFLVVELECSSLLAWAVVATCSRCSIFLMLHNTRTRYTWHGVTLTFSSWTCCDIALCTWWCKYFSRWSNIFQILHGSPGHLWEHKHSVCFTQIWRPDPPPPSPHRTESLETRARGTVVLLQGRPLHCRRFYHFLSKYYTDSTFIVRASHKSYWPRLTKNMSFACLWRWGAIGRAVREDQICVDNLSLASIKYL